MLSCERMNGRFRIYSKYEKIWKNLLEIILTQFHSKKKRVMESMGKIL